VRSALLYSIIISLFTISCRKDVGQINYGNYPADVGKIIGTTCAVSGCHNEKSYLAAANYNLESWTSMFKGTNSGSPVIPYSSKFSSLCYYINTYAELGPQSVPTMPINKAPLSYEQVKLIKDWIDRGAPDLGGNVMWADNPLRKKLYAVNQGCNVVTVLDAETQLPMRYIEVGKPIAKATPHQVRVSPDGNYWYVIFINYNVMEKYRCSDDSFVGSIPLSPLAAGTGSENALNWNTFTITKDSKMAYCVSWESAGHVAAVDLQNQKLIHYRLLTNNPHAVTLNDNETKVYVGAQTGNYITEMDTDFVSTNEISLENGAINYLSSLDIHDMVLSPVTKNELFITCQKTDEVRVYNISTNSVTAIIPTGKYPQEIVYAKAVNKYYVSCTNDNTVPNTLGVITKIDPVSLTSANLPCGYQPHGIAVDENKKLLYVLSRNISVSGPAPHHTNICGGRNGFVNFIDLNIFKVLSKKYELSDDPYFIFARP